MDQLSKHEIIFHKSGLDITLGDDSLFFRQGDNMNEAILNLETLPSEFWDNMASVECVVVDLKRLEM